MPYGRRCDIFNEEQPGTLGGDQRSAFSAGLPNGAYKNALNVMALRKSESPYLSKKNEPAATYLVHCVRD